MNLRIVILITLLTLPFRSNAQVYPFSLKGRVTDTSGKGVDGANVMLRKPGSTAMIGFTLSDPDGTYSISVNTEADTLQVLVSGFNISSHSKIVTRRTGTADFTVSSQQQTIREAKVAADPIKRGGDTLTYYVSQFKEETDRSIGDVLKKMPGIEVSSSGGIKYNGRSINKFYIEGLDMLGGKYGIATNNIQASDIASVEVYEGHQPIHVLQDRVKSDEAALNLKLKQGVKGTWNGILELGGGYAPALWTGSFTPMMFSQHFQTILTYKTNNTGNDVGQELKSQFGGVGSIPSLVSCVSPQTPPLDERSWLRNNIHAASANGILKINDDSDITVKTHYIHDTQHSSGSTRTEYFVSGMPSFTVEETTGLKDKTDELELELQYRLNSKKRYILDEMSVKAERTEDYGTVLKGGTALDQTASLPFFNATNRLQYVKTFGSTQVTARSTTSFSKRDSYLDVTPNHYGDILGTRETVRQDISSRKFYSTNSVSTSFRTGGLIIGLIAQGNYDIESFKSELAPADSMRNDLPWKRFDARLGTSLSYQASRFDFDLSIPVSYIVINGEGRPLFDPSVSARYRLNQSLTFRASASQSYSFSGLYDSYGGYVMTNYRNISSRGGKLNKSSNSSASFETSYLNAVNAFFVNGSIAYSKTGNELTYGTIYNGDFTTVKQYDMRDESDVTALSLNASKRFQSISTTVKAGVDASESHYQYLRQDILMPVTRRTLSANWGIDSRLGQSMLISYMGRFSDGENRFDGSSTASIKTMNQLLSMSFLLGQHLIAKGSFRHYYNDRNEGAQRNLCFVDAGLSYVLGRMEYTLSANNLLNTKTYSTTTFNTNTIYSTVYELRPVSVLLSIKFSLR